MDRSGWERQGRMGRERFGEDGIGSDWIGKAGMERSGQDGIGLARQERICRRTVSNNGCAMILATLPSRSLYQAWQMEAYQVRKEKLEAPTGIGNGVRTATSRLGKIGTAETPQRTATIKPVSFETVTFDIIGIDPMVMNRMGKKGREGLEGIALRSPTEGKSQRPKKIARDFNAEFLDAQHTSTEGWVGIAAMGIKHGMVAVCVIADFFKTRAKMLIFVEPDGYSEYATPLFRITKGAPTRYEDVGRVKSGGMQTNVRAMFAPGWEATVKIKYDSDAMTLNDVANLLNRAGQQCGLGEGRPSSRDSVGCGWGRYKIVGT